MTGGEILVPMLGMMVLTAIVWFVLYARRIPAMRRAQRPVQEYTTPEKGALQLPEEVNYPSNNLKNLFELPVLFYAICLYLYVTGSADTAYVIAAWAFVALRAVHSLIQCTTNVVMHRFVTYMAGAVALWFIVLRAALQAF